MSFDPIHKCHGIKSAVFNVIRQNAFAGLNIPMADGSDDSAVFTPDTNRLAEDLRCIAKFAPWREDATHQV